MPDPSPPPYKVYRSRKRLRDRFGGGGQTALDALRRRGRGGGPPQTGAPGHGEQRINAAFALGGPALTIKTVESFLGNDLHVNHVILVSFSDFPDLIDALGGVDVKLDNCVKSNSFGGKKLKLKKGEHHLT